MHGIVIRNTGNSYIVRTDDGQEVECKVKGNFRLRGIRSTSPVAVGDGVTVNMPPSGTGDNRGGYGTDVFFITEIDERRNYIVRKATSSPPILIWQCL